MGLSPRNVQVFVPVAATASRWTTQVRPATSVTGKTGFLNTLFSCQGAQIPARAGHSGARQPVNYSTVTGPIGRCFLVHRGTPSLASEPMQTGSIGSGSAGLPRLAMCSGVLPEAIF